MKVQYLLFVVLVILLSSCMPAAKSRLTKVTANNISKALIANTPLPVFLPDENLYWYTTVKIGNNITLNSNFTDFVFLRGKYVHDFLGTTPYSTSQFCLSIPFSNGQALPLRVRAIPTTITNANRSVERSLRINFSLASENSAACASAATGASVNAYSLATICGVNASNNCSGIVTSSSISLYSIKTNPLTLMPVPNSAINLLGPIVNVDLLSNTITTAPSCNDSSCIANGMDCCLNNACVKDASLKINAAAQTEYQVALAAVRANPMAFLNYANVYNICQNITHKPTLPAPATVATTAMNTALTQLATQTGWYNCMNDVSLGLGYANCLPGKTDADYQAIKTKVASSCGCPTCNYSYTPIYTTGTNNISGFNCLIPQIPSATQAVTNLSIQLSSRTAPHRFFDSSGINYHDFLSLQTAKTIVQEGSPFSYADPINKALPVGSNLYNMNAILGSMNIDLTASVPAQAIDVTIGKSYYLYVSGTSSITHCFLCAPDSWNSTYFAFPASMGGSGIMPSPYATSRKDNLVISSYANYEDSHFGRACYIPPTMVPFSHAPDKITGNLQTQRLNRLKTQAALYVNGYQKDWFGFNRGTIIGSYDGVTWFAIGSNRRIVAGGSKLFLAINAPFSDLATYSTTTVKIVDDNSATVTAEYDYDPDLGLNDARQNTGGTCQHYHQCSNDSDCIANLGWEYSCAQVDAIQTSWPNFDGNGNELNNQTSSINLFTYLGQKNTNGNKRCVYRGSGAPCIIGDVKNACAPNFTCTSIASSSFNDELVRVPADDSVILKSYGVSAKYLGRQMNYIGANRSLPIEVQNNLKANSITGICRPGNALKKADYISQVGFCDNSVNNITRVSSCPVIDEVTLNYTAQVAGGSSTQNSCGGASKTASAANAAVFVSTFLSIENPPLSVLPVIDHESLPADACLRKAGSVCHTDLDCAPNYLHSDLAATYNSAKFGGTEAELKYWKETLICGQGKEIPIDPFNLDYKLSDNKCCRAVGNDFTMYTQGLSTDATLNPNLSVAPSNDPTLLGRYSRYSVSKTATNNVSALPKVNSNLEPAANQWKVINETGSKTCCGGGWIRKFTDSTHDWRKKSRLNFDPTNLKCLNFRTNLIQPSPNSNSLNAASLGINPAALAADQSRLCSTPPTISGGNRYTGCAQITFGNNFFDLSAPTLYDPAVVANILLKTSLPAGWSRLDTTPSPQGIQSFLPDAPFAPEQISLPLNSSKTKGSYFSDLKLDPFLAFYLPAYIADPYNKMKVSFRLIDNNGKENTILPNLYSDQALCQSSLTATKDTNFIPENSWCLTTASNGRIIFITRTSIVTYNYGGVIIDFETIESNKGIKVVEPGGPLYYLSKLERLELVGIPQITYEPIYCSNDQNTIVPGIFKSTYATRDSLNGQFPTYRSSNALDRIRTSDTPINNPSTDPDYFTYASNDNNQSKLSITPIFSDKEFSCCRPLGETTSDTTKCCSGFGILNADGRTSTCKIPKGTDLHVYFNRFVSNEGTTLVNDSALEDEIDFNMFTGIPKYRNSTQSKIMTLGQLHCENGTTTNGGLFGAYQPEQQIGMSASGSTDFFNSIVDSVFDSINGNLFSGYMGFQNGFRWNHHLYCD